MKIFNNFDTELKGREYKEARKLYGDDNALLVQRYIAYWIIKGIIPFIIVIALNLIIFFFLFKIDGTIVFDILKWIVIIGDIFFLYNLFNIFLEYKYDFTLVTPKGIVTYKQKGLFNSKLKDLPTMQIRSTQSYRSGIIGNILSYGIIEIITDGGLGGSNIDGSSQAGKTRLTYVHHPGSIRKQIAKIILLDSK